MLLTLHKNLTKLRGIGLLELMLSIAIISVLLIMATRYYQNATQGKNISNTISIIGGYTAAETQYMSFSGNYTGTFADLNLPASLQTDPWGGTITLATKASPNGFTITLPNVPDTVCTKYLQNMIQTNTGGTVDCSSGLKFSYPS